MKDSRVVVLEHLRDHFWWLRNCYVCKHQRSRWCHELIGSVEVCKEIGIISNKEAIALINRAQEIVGEDAE
jgi:hypothetical protein